MGQILFLGLGKSNTGLAKIVPGEKWGFVENADGSVEQSVFQDGQWQSRGSIFGSFDSFDWSRFTPEMVFVSPGIDPRRPFMTTLASYEMRELDYVASRFRGKILAITGTDGKSTMTVQAGAVLKRAFPSHKVFVGGNLGTPMSDLLLEPYDWAVLEVSSFQAERLKTARLDYAVLINLAPDHLDRYDSLEDYFEAKWQLLRRAHFCFYPHDQRPQKGAVNKSMAEYSNTDEISLILQKVMTQVLSCEGVAVGGDFFDKLPTLPHRQEIWRDSQGAYFVNDSKATTVHAASYGMRHLSQQFKRLHWILGGRHKGDDFSELLPLIRPQDVVCVVGEARDLIQGQLRGRGQIFASLRTCLDQLIPSLQEGEALVLSPGCSSYDEFNNFEERGDFFMAEVRRLRGEVQRVAPPSKQSKV